MQVYTKYTLSILIAFFCLLHIPQTHAVRLSTDVSEEIAKKILKNRQKTSLPIDLFKTAAIAARSFGKYIPFAKYFCKYSSLICSKYMSKKLSYAINIGSYSYLSLINIIALRKMDNLNHLTARGNVYAAIRSEPVVSYKNLTTYVLKQMGSTFLVTLEASFMMTYESTGNKNDLISSVGLMLLRHYFTGV